MTSISCAYTRTLVILRQSQSVVLQAQLALFKAQAPYRRAARLRFTIHNPRVREDSVASPRAIHLYGFQQIVRPRSDTHIPSTVSLQCMLTLESDVGPSSSIVLQASSCEFGIWSGHNASITFRESHRPSAVCELDPTPLTSRAHPDSACPNAPNRPSATARIVPRHPHSPALPASNPPSAGVPRPSTHGPSHAAAVSGQEYESAESESQLKSVDERDQWCFVSVVVVGTRSTKSASSAVSVSMSRSELHSADPHPGRGLADPEMDALDEAEADEAARDGDRDTMPLKPVAQGPRLGMLNPIAGNPAHKPPHASALDTQYSILNTQQDAGCRTTQYDTYDPPRVPCFCAPGLGLGLGPSVRTDAPPLASPLSPPSSPSFALPASYPSRSSGTSRSASSVYWRAAARSRAAGRTRARTACIVLLVCGMGWDGVWGGCVGWDEICGMNVWDGMGCDECVAGWTGCWCWCW